MVFVHVKFSTNHYFSFAQIFTQRQTLEKQGILKKSDKIITNNFILSLDAIQFRMYSSCMSRNAN